MLHLLQNTENLSLREAMVTGLEIEKNDFKRKDTEVCRESVISQIKGIQTYFGSVYFAKAVILTTGTFLRGQIWIGNQSMEAGRAGEQAAQGLTEALVGLGFETNRLKTGTPPRLDGDTINYNELEMQPADHDHYYFSFLSSL